MQVGDTDWAFEVFVDAFFILDLFFNFRTAYLNDEVTDRSLCAKLLSSLWCAAVGVAALSRSCVTMACWPCLLTGGARH